MQRESRRTGQNEVVLWAVEGEHRPHALLVTFQGVLELPVLPDFRGPAEDADQLLYLPKECARRARWLWSAHA